MGVIRYYYDHRVGNFSVVAPLACHDQVPLDVQTRNLSHCWLAPDVSALFYFDRLNFTDHHAYGLLGLALISQDQDPCQIFVVGYLVFEIKNEQHLQFGC